MLNAFRFATSSLGLPILGYRFGQGASRQLVVGGVHGDEAEGVWAATRLLGALAELEAGLSLDGFFRAAQMDAPKNLVGLLRRRNVVVVPALNIDGVLNRTRVTSTGVDLNRNLPTKDWSPEVLNPRYPPGPAAGSEPENQGLCQFLSQEQPCFVISLHSFKPMLNLNGDCERVAQAIHRVTGYELVRDMGYPTPGCLGTYTGLERNIPTITYEIERGLDPKEVTRLHPAAVLVGLCKEAESEEKR